MSILTRRLFIATPLALAPWSVARGAEPSPVFPAQGPDLARDMVSVSHGNVARVKELVARQPSLAKAAWDWGFGDWETAMGAASHVANREIAAILVDNGAQPTLFTAAMLGQLEVVKAAIAANPGIQRTKGPHSITLLRHAVLGGPQARPVAEYLQDIGGADDSLPQQPLTPAEIGRLTGAYVFGSGPTDQIDITFSNNAVMFGRVGGTARGLFHLGGWVFCPVGAEHVRIRFVDADRGITLTVHDPDVVMTARRVR